MVESVKNQLKQTTYIQFRCALQSDPARMFTMNLGIPTNNLHFLTGGRVHAKQLLFESLYNTGIIKLNKRCGRLGQFLKNDTLSCPRSQGKMSQVPGQNLQSQLKHHKWLLSDTQKNTSNASHTKKNALDTYSLKPSPRTWVKTPIFFGGSSGYHPRKGTFYNGKPSMNEDVSPIKKWGGFPASHVSFRGSSFFGGLYF